MQNVLLQLAMKLNKSRKHRQWWNRAVRTLVMVVVFCTTYALILPAITMEGDAQCGMEAHLHEEGCYEKQPVYSLECGLETGVTVLHSHSGLCFDQQGALRCAMPVLEEHIHTEACFVRSDVPACGFVHVHSESCPAVKQVLVCGMEEVQPHTHDETCTGAVSVLACDAADAEHIHDDGCYTLQEQVCPRVETAGHQHMDTCFEQQGVACTQTTVDGHVHEDACFPLVQICGRQELRYHAHGTECSDTAGNLTCTLPEIQAHSHTEACLKDTGMTIPVLTCGREAHSHTDLCYPDEENKNESIYLCGSGVHSHVAECYDENEQLICTIPAHTHEAACLVADLDLMADVETPEQWEAAFAGLTMTGDWSRDLLTIARTQLGYRESIRNLVLEDQTLKGYSRYGAKYGAPYGDWNALFVRFCLDYAGVKDYPVDSDADSWLHLLQTQQLFAGVSGYQPAAGDLIFLDVDSDGTADYMGILVEAQPDSGKWKYIAGDTINQCVEYETVALTDETIAGFGPLPVNPMSGEALNQAEDVSNLIRALPDATTARDNLLALNRVMNRDAYDAYLQTLSDRVAQAKEAYNGLDEEQKALTENVSLLAELELVCAEAAWEQLPVMTAEDGRLTALRVMTAEEKTVELQQTALFGFQGETAVYGSTAYGEARVKLEFALPLPKEKAVFDMDAMSWLEDGNLTSGKRTFDEQEVECQILTGYLRLTASTMDQAVVPGDFTGEAAVKVLKLEHGDPVNLRISAAMEYNTWDGSCQTHQTEEKLTIVSEIYRVYAPASEEEQQAAYEAFLQNYQELIGQELPEEETAAQADALWAEVSEAFLKGRLSEEAHEELAELLGTLRYGDLNTVAETARGNAWMILRDSGWFEEFSHAAEQFAETIAAPVPFAGNAAAGGGAKLMMRSRSTNNAKQIIDYGGENVSKEGAVYVSKTIAPTDRENVFDITLEVITQDIVTEVYKEPDMAVVIVMDISETMNDPFDGSTRYKAAMTAAESFLDQFASNNLGASKVGFVAFNTDAHQVFGMQSCSTTAQVTSLKNTMRSETGKIVNANGYEDSHSRFTNVEAGLKRAYDLLNTVDNDYKYIVFLSDGFPTTYLNTDTSAKYDGYDPYDSSGSRFYDSVEKYNNKKRPCSYGTSYSDEAAIRARKMAVSLKNEGVKIFSIGVDIGGQTIKYYVDKYEGRSFSVVDRRNTNYEIGSASDSNAFKNWLKTSIGSGAGYYFDSDDTDEMADAFEDVFAKILELNAESSHLDWVASDPMPDMDESLTDTVEFIGFYNKDGELVEGDLVGACGDGWDYENTASFDESESTIQWDLKQSGYVSMTYDGVTRYDCTLTYRVRLQNEKGSFVEYKDYDTNAETALKYRIIDKTGAVVTVSEQQEVQFPIPVVEGYLGDLQFYKVDSHGSTLKGAEFTLTHDTAGCGACRGDGTGHVPLATMKRTSGEDGLVLFEDVPSGHVYQLAETGVPDGYMANGNTYQVSIAYDVVTVNAFDRDGNPVEWDGNIVNMTYYELPRTGGTGTHLYSIGGMALLMAAAYLLWNNQKRNRKEGRSCR